MISSSNQICPRIHSSDEDNNVCHRYWHTDFLSKKKAFAIIQIRKYGESRARQIKNVFSNVKAKVTGYWNNFPIPFNSL